MNETVRDQFGYEISRGDIITYPVRQSSSLWMSVGVVKDVKTKMDTWKRPVHSVSVVIVAPKSWNDKTLVTRNTTMSSPSRTTIVHQFNLEAMPDEGYGVITRTTMAALRQIRKTIMENRDVPKSIPPLPSGPDNGSVV